MKLPLARWLTLLVPAFSLALAAGAEEPSKPARQNVEDYFLMLPDCCDKEPAKLLDAIRKGKAKGIIDRTNGYLDYQDGESACEVALFRFRDGRPLLAVCEGDFDSPKPDMLEFYVLGQDGGMKMTDRPIFPVANADGRYFVLPRQGRTVIVRRYSGRNERRFTWDGEKFVEEPAAAPTPTPAPQYLTDYLPLLPPGALGLTPARLAQLLDESDETHATMSFGSTDEQAFYHLALYRYKDGRPLVFVYRKKDDQDEGHLDLYTRGADGRMTRAARSIFPVPEGPGFMLLFPDMGDGTNVEVRGPSENNTEYKWDGERFVPSE